MAERSGVRRGDPRRGAYAIPVSYTHLNRFIREPVSDGTLRVSGVGEFVCDAFRSFSGCGEQQPHPLFGYSLGLEILTQGRGSIVDGNGSSPHPPFPLKGGRIPFNITSLRFCRNPLSLESPLYGSSQFVNPLRQFQSLDDPSRAHGRGCWRWFSGADRRRRGRF